MQFRAGILYVVLFAVVAAGAYGVIATAESPEVTVDQADADYELTEGDEFDVGGQTWNVSSLSGGSGTVEHVEANVTFEAQWEGASAANDDSWDNGDAVALEEGQEYNVYIHGPSTDEDGNESAPEAITLIADIDEDTYDVIERDDGVYVTVTSDDTEEVVNVDEVDEIDSTTVENGSEIAFYQEDQGAQVDGQIVAISADVVTVEYVGDEVTENELGNTEPVTLNDEEFVAYFPNPDEAYLTSNVDVVESQQADLQEFNDRIRGLWWVVSIAALTAITIASLAYMPVRG